MRVNKKVTKDVNEINNVVQNDNLLIVNKEFDMRQSPVLTQLRLIDWSSILRRKCGCLCINRTSQDNYSVGCKT